MDDQTQARISAILEVPFNQHLGLILDEAGAGEARAHFDVGPEHLAFGGLHAGVLYSLMEAACLFALLDSLDGSEHAVTHDLHASVMRSARIGERCDLIARVVRRGRTLAFVEARGEVGGKVIAAIQVTKSIVKPGAA
ncbi:PaaI family thioesterase [Cupriavidus necator]|uniref:PaaI family thioesterase n=1 Tax=Cupriavidus necator TaxID=106590 RepID=UPI0005B54321